MVPENTTNRNIAQLYKQLYQSYMSDDQFLLKDSMDLLHEQLIPFVVSIMKKRNIRMDNDFYQEIFETCIDECKYTCMKFKVDPDSHEITKYLSTVIWNTISNRLEKLLDAKNNGFIVQSLDYEVVGKDGETMCFIDTVSKNEGKSVLMELMRNLLMKDHKSSVEDWLCKVVFEGMTRTEVAEEYGITPSYVAREIKKYAKSLQSSL